MAADEAGAEVGSLTVAATSSGHLGAVQWAAELLAAGETVVRVPPKMMASQRRSARTRGMSDPIDVLAVARAALREPDLPVAQLDGPAREVKLLVDYRETLIRERTGLQNRLRRRLHELDPSFDPPAESLDRDITLEAVMTMLAERQGLVADLARRETIRIEQITREANQLERDIAVRVAAIVPSLLEVPGCGALTAAKLVGEAADITRFRNRDAYAMWAGVAPIPVWSGNPDRFRLNRGGNRQTNAALHRVAVIQIRMHPDAKRFMTRRLGNGDTKREALRALKRRLADVVYRTMIKDTHTTSQAAQPRAA